MMNLDKFFGKRICVAISGGADSVALLHTLKNVSAEKGFALCAAHCEHGIRGEESLADMRFVEELCREWGITLYTFSEDCLARAKREKESVETAARNFRYACFERLINEGKADYIALAHHKNDEAETVLFRLARGASLTGATGMKEESGYLLRPLLQKTRAEIEEYIAANGLTYRTDKTNFDGAYTRNKLRLEILPKLEEAVNGAVENLARFATLAQADDELLYEYAKDLLLETEEGYTVAFSEKKPLFCRACLLALKGLGVLRDYTQTHLSALFDLQSLERGARLDMPSGVTASKTEKGVCFYRKKPACVWEKPTPQFFDESGWDGGRYAVNVSKAPLEGENVLRLDREKLPREAVFRFRQEGDYIHAFGGGRKTLKKYLNEKKIPVEIREYLPLIADGAEIYAICGVEISEKVKVDENSKSVLYIRIMEK